MTLRTEIKNILIDHIYGDLLIGEATEAILEAVKKALPTKPFHGTSYDCGFNDCNKQILEAIDEKG